MLNSIKKLFCILSLFEIVILTRIKSDPPISFSRSESTSTSNTGDAYSYSGSNAETVSVNNQLLLPKSFQLSRELFDVPNVDPNGGIVNANTNYNFGDGNINNNNNNNGGIANNNNNNNGGTGGSNNNNNNNVSTGGSVISNNNNNVNGIGSITNNNNNNLSNKGSVVNNNNNNDSSKKFLDDSDKKEENIKSNKDIKIVSLKNNPKKSSKNLNKNNNNDTAKSYKDIDILIKEKYYRNLDRELSKPNYNDCLKINWKETKFKANDIGLSPQGVLYAIDSTSGSLFQYIFSTGKYKKVQGDFDLTNLVEVDVSYDATPYVISKIGDVHFLSCDHKWERLDGCATDIAIGRFGEVYKTGCEEVKDENGKMIGFGVYKLICEQENCNKCFRFREKFKSNFTYKSDDKNCFWFRMDGAGVKIAVGPSGNPYVIDMKGRILGYDGSSWNQIIRFYNAIDMSISNDGVLFFIDQNNRIWKTIVDDPNEMNLLNTKVQCLEGEATNITVGPLGQPFITKIDGNVLTCSRTEYN